MISKIHSLVLFICSGIVLLLALICWMRPEPIFVHAPLLTKELVQETKIAQEQSTQKRQQAENTRKHNELKVRMVSCQSDEECIIVDKDPCGCLKGPSAVTAINSNFSLEFSKMMEKQFAAATACPSVGSTEKECSASAHAVCREQHCQIAY